MTYVELYARGGIELHERLSESVRARMLGIAKRFWEDSRIYGPGNVLWRFEPAGAEWNQLSLLSRVLAATVYNPWRSVPVRYQKHGDYNLGELKASIREAVDQDDDILTQFMEADEIKRQLQEADSFEEVVALLRRMQEEQAVEQ